jgi:serine/threonine protein kinase
VSVSKSSVESTFDGVATEPRTIGPWTLHRRLGEGGNAKVWEACDEDGRTCALKLLNSSRAGREPYQRFVREIEFLRAVDDEGVLPLIDAHLPEHPGPDNRAWLAMPIARPVAEALEGAALETIVAAVRTFAASLARLAAEHGVAHRDIKPGNLYELDGAWLVGDFGLVGLPDVEELTRTGRPLGPAHFLAYEMITDPANADPHPADVFSVAKTLWVLACGQNFPPQGQQPSTRRGLLIADSVAHPHAAVLDRLVDRMTRVRADERPTMQEVAEELAQWEQLSTEGVVVDVSEARQRLHTSMRAEFDQQDLLEQQREMAVAAVRRYQELVAPLNQALRDLHPHPTIDAMDDRLMQNLTKTHEHSGTPEFVWRWHRSSSIGAGDEWNRYALRVGRGLELTADGDLLIHAAIEVGIIGIGGSDFSWSSAVRGAPVGTAASEEALSTTARELVAAFQQAVETFVSWVAPAP